MKFSLIVAVVVLALAQGSFTQDATTELEKLGQYFEQMKNKMVQDLTEIVRNQDLANQAQTQLQPLVAQIQEQLKTVATNVEEQIKPLTANVQGEAQVQLEAFKTQLQTIFAT
ncbi:hypothetical protein, partial [Oceanospirillum sediminis]